MTDVVGIDILSMIVTSLGVLIALFLIFLQYIPERRRRKLELLYDKYLDLESKYVDVVILEREIDRRKLEERIKKEKIFISSIFKILDQSLKFKLYNKEFSLNKVNGAVFSYLISIFCMTIIYSSLVSLQKLPIEEKWIFVLVILTVVGYIILIPVVYLSLVKDYSLKLWEE